MLNPIKYLQYHQDVSPKFIAIQALDKAYTFRELFSIVKKVAFRLRQLGVKPNQLVVNCFNDPLLDWIMTLAIFHEASITCSNHGYPPLENTLKVDWILTDRPEITGLPPEKTLTINAAWINESLAGVHHNDPNEYVDASSLCRLMLTSGTTGHRKSVAISIADLEGRLKTGLTYWTTPGREINLQGLSTIGGFFSVLDALSVGAPLYLFQNRVIDTIRKFNINSLIGSPVQIANLLGQITNPHEYPTSIEIVRVSGGAMSPLLLKNIKEKLTHNIVNVYGSTELGGVCISRPLELMSSETIAGYALPDVQIQIVNELHKVLPHGNEGSIRVKAPFMVHEYYNDQEGSAKSFIDGWFYPGDRGRLMNDGLLVLGGRNSELINRGGVKIDPASIDQFLLDYEGIKDAAVFGLENKMGIEDIAAAIVAVENFDTKALKLDLMKKYGADRTPSLFFFVAQIPRNHMGKVMRGHMSNFFAEFMAKREEEKKFAE